jgi:hypothetical protein
MLTLDLSGIPADGGGSHGRLQWKSHNLQLHDLPTRPRNAKTAIEALRRCSMIIREVQRRVFSGQYCAKACHFTCCAGPKHTVPRHSVSGAADGPAWLEKLQPMTQTYWHCRWGHENVHEHGGWGGGLKGRRGGWW